MQFYNVLRELMIENGKSAKDLADALKIDGTQVYAYLNNEGFPNLKNTLLIAEYLGVSLECLVFDKDGGAPVSLKKLPPFSVAFQNILKEKNKTRYVLSKKHGFSRARLDDYFHAKRVPSIDTLIRLASALDCTLDHLVGLD